MHATISALMALKKRKWTAGLIPYVIFGVLPDTYALITLPFVLLGLKTQYLDQTFMAQYNVTHSLVIFFMIGIALSLWFRKIYWPFAMYGLHIVTDMISHQHYPTPFLWPLSSLTVTGAFEYTEPKIVLWTYAIMVPIWAFLLLNRKIRAEK